MTRAHGSDLRGLHSVTQPDAPFGRFGRLFGPPVQYGERFAEFTEALAALAETMIAREFEEKDKEGRLSSLTSIPTDGNEFPLPWVGRLCETGDQMFIGAGHTRHQEPPTPYAIDP